MIWKFLILQISLQTIYFVIIQDGSAICSPLGLVNMNWFSRLLKAQVGNPFPPESHLSDFETEMILQKKTRIKPKGKEQGGLWVNRKPSGKLKPRSKPQSKNGRPKDDN